MDNPLTLSNLLSAVTYWRTEKRSWNPDFHNSLYTDLSEFRSSGLNQDWWAAIVDVLWDWRAIRPKSKQYIYDRGIARLSDLNFQYGHILDTARSLDLDLETAGWSSLAPLYLIAHDIKNVDSPVFGSKLCHFILPDAFPIFDWEALGIPIHTYKEYWTQCSSLWRSCSVKQELIAELRQVITDPAGYPYLVEDIKLARDFPWSTKITELCLIGRSHS